MAFKPDYLGGGFSATFVNLTLTGTLTFGDVSVQSLSLGDDDELRFGDSNDVRIAWQTADADYLGIAVTGVSRNVIISEDNDTDWGHAASTDPTLWIQSADETDTSDYIALSHDQTNAVIGVGNGGLDVSGASQVLLSNGAVGTPALAFENDADTGLYLEATGSIGFANGGSHSAGVTAGQIFYIGAVDQATTLRSSGTLRASDVAAGGAGDIAGADLTIAAGLGTGTGDPGQVIFQVAPVAAAGDNIQTRATVLTLDSGQALFAPGAAAAPSVSFATDTDTGLYRIGADNIGIAVGGVNIIDISQSSVVIQQTGDAALVLRDTDHTAASTSARFFLQAQGSDEAEAWMVGDTGSGHNDLVLRATIANAKVDVQVNGSSPVHFTDDDQSLFANGTVAIPSISFQSDTNTGFYRIGANRLGITAAGSAKLEANNEGIAVIPSNTASITAGGGITPTRAVMRVQGSGGAVTVTATPSIVSGLGVDGQILIIQGDSDANTVKLQDEAQLANTDLQLSGGTDMTLGKGDTLTLVYDSGDGKWYEIARSDN